MSEREIVYDLDGDVFTGRYEIIGHGETAAVSVHFDGNSISAIPGHLGAEVVARTLLGELVREKLTSREGWPSLAEDLHSAVQARRVHYRYGPQSASPARR